MSWRNQLGLGTMVLLALILGACELVALAAAPPTAEAPPVATPTQESDGGGAEGTPPPASLRDGRTGTIWQATIGGPGYLAIPIGPGHLVTICGPAACWTTVSTDAGPNHEMLVQGRIADVALGQWRRICGLSSIRGSCHGSWRLAGKAGPTPPPTDIGP